MRIAGGTFHVPSTNDPSCPVCYLSGFPSSVRSLAMPVDLRFALADVLRERVRPLVPGDEVLANVLAAGRVVRLAKGEAALRAGETADDLLFVGDGLLRMVTIDPGTGGERTAQFFDEGMVFTDPVSFLLRTPSALSIEAIEPSVLLALPRSTLFGAYDGDHAIERFGRLMVEEALVGTQRRASRLLNLSVEERYTTFVATRPEVARRVPQYLIASYLGVTPEALSRVRGRIARAGGAGSRS